MRFTTLLVAGYSALCAAQNHDAVVIENNPRVVYEAKLPLQHDSNIHGSVRASRGPDGVGVKFNVHFSRLPKEGGPFKYHIHLHSVSSDDKCVDALGHLDPYGRGDDPPCQSDHPETCQVGDLSGKHGVIKSAPFKAEYVDKYASLEPGSPAFIGDKSIVLHLNDKKKTRIACGNFQLQANSCPH